MNIIMKENNEKLKIKNQKPITKNKKSSPCKPSDNKKKQKNENKLKTTESSHLSASTATTYEISK